MKFLEFSRGRAARLLENLPGRKDDATRYAQIRLRTLPNVSGERIGGQAAKR
jgi:hypothetical protein